MMDRTDLDQPHNNLPASVRQKIDQFDALKEKR